MPDLSDLEIFLWRHMKDLTYECPIEKDIVPMIAVVPGDILEMPDVIANVHKSYPAGVKRALELMKDILSKFIKHAH